MDLTAISSALSSFKSLTDMVRTFVDVKADVAVNDRVLAIQSLLFDLQNKLIAANATQTALTDRVRELEEEIRRGKQWAEEKANYALHEAAPGTFVYVHKSVGDGGAGAHWLCANCFENGKKSILQAGGYKASRYIHVCQACKSEFIGKWIEPAGVTIQPRPQRGTW